MSRLALAYTFTSLALARLVCGGEPVPDPGTVAGLELEAKLAKKPAVYLVLDPARRVLEVRARATVLDTVKLTGLEIASQQSLLRRSLPQSPAIPALWAVKMGPGDLDREVIAPSELRPIPKDDEEPVEEAQPVAGTPGPTPSPTPNREPPASYRANLENGWDLWVVEQLPAQTRFGLFLEAIRDGWNRLRGESADFAPSITLAMERADALRVHHLLHSGMAILVLSATP
jgi:hypothetical protein